MPVYYVYMCSEQNAQGTGAWDKNLSKSTLLGTFPLQGFLLTTGAGTLRGNRLPRLHLPMAAAPLWGGTPWWAAEGESKDNSNRQLSGLCVRALTDACCEHREKDLPEEFEKACFWSFPGASRLCPSPKPQHKAFSGVKWPRRSCSRNAPTVVIPCGDISCSICGALQDSCSRVFLGGFTGSAGHSPPLFCPPFIPATIFKMAGIQSKHSVSTQSF